MAWVLLGSQIMSRRRLQYTCCCCCHCFFMLYIVFFLFIFRLCCKYLHIGLPFALFRILWTLFCSTNWSSSETQKATKSPEKRRIFQQPLHIFCRYRWRPSLWAPGGWRRKRKEKRRSVGRIFLNAANISRGVGQQRLR